MKLYGLIGYPLSHSFSKKYFTEKFEKEHIQDCSYELYAMEDVSEVLALIQNTPALRGLNVTVPHKQAVIPLLDALDASAQRIGAVNVIKISKNGKTKGYNSDYYGFKLSLEKFVGNAFSGKALVLGTGGASKAVVAALDDLHIDYQYVSRRAAPGVFSYDQLTGEIIRTHTLIINTSPVGMYPAVDDKPLLPYEAIGSGHYLFDLVYNPLQTAFMKAGAERGAHTLNGLEMLYGQADKAWEIWNAE